MYKSFPSRYVLANVLVFLFRVMLVEHINELHVILSKSNVTRSMLSPRQINNNSLMIIKLNTLR